MFNKFGCFRDCYEQYAYALFYGGELLLKSPSIHIGGYTTTSKKVELAPFGSETIFWYKGERPEETCLPEDMFKDTTPSGTIDSINAIMKDNGISIIEPDIEAIIRDELYHDRNDLDIVLNRCFQNLSYVPFVDEEQADEFIFLLEELWDNIENKYNRKKDKKRAKHRTKFLKLFEKILVFIRSFDAEEFNPFDEYKEEMLILMQTNTMISEVLFALNDDTYDVETDIASLKTTYNETKKIIDEIIDTVTGYLEEPENNDFFTNKNTPVKSEFQLKIALKDIRPTIWRRISVPDNITLYELHMIIQIVMGWTNSHLHEFTINGELYGAPENDDSIFGDSINNEMNVKLSDVIHKPKQKFQYLYDFGDSWEHTVTVEKISPADKKNSIPICLDGARNCPPEDCGSVHGYYNILKTLNSPEEETDEDLLTWLGDYDPEEFDIIVINNILKNS